MSESVAIVKVESTFENVYRITTENGIILDIPEKDRPNVGTSIEYAVGHTLDNSTIMNGFVFHTNGKYIYVSFGGLLGSIPIKIFPNCTSSAHSAQLQEFTLSYKLIN